MLDVRRLHLLRDLDRLGTITAVAAAHTYTPSAVSQQLSALERETGLALLERTGRTVTLTAAGHLLVQHTHQVLAALENTEAALAHLTTGLTGPLRIGAFPTAARTLLPQVLVTLGDQHPHLDLMITELDPVDVPAHLHNRTLDVGLLHDYDTVPAVPDPTLDTTPLLDETVYLAVPADTAATSLADCAQTPWILATPGTLCHTVTHQVCHAAGFTPRPRHHADDFTTVLTLIAARQGVSLVPELAATNPPAGVRLIALSTRRQTRIVHRRGAATHPAIAAFTTTIRAVSQGRRHAPTERS